MDDPDGKFGKWCRDVANARVHATTNRVVAEAFVEERASLIPLPAHPYDTVLTVERRVSRDGMVSVDGSLYSVPDDTRSRVSAYRATPPRCASSRRATPAHAIP